MYKVILKPNEEKRIKEGYMWVYANEVSKITGVGKQGSIASVASFSGEVLGYGIINHASKIIVRLLSREFTELDLDFFMDRLGKAKREKEALGYSDNYRVVFSESDGLPGLIVDKYGEYLSIQVLSLGMDKVKDVIISALVSLFNPKGIYERSDVPSRVKEGLKEVKQTLYGEVPDLVTISENGLQMQVDIKNGQKTGYFLDQKENRAAIKRYVKDKEVLDCFCNVGGFGLNALAGGASNVYFLDISADALRYASMNAKLNGFSNYETIETDVFKALRKYIQEKCEFDVIVLDPPAFIKQVDSIKNGYRGYVDINKDALSIVKRGGYLVTCSCSEHLSPTMFFDMIKDALKLAKRKAKLVEMRYQSPDHASLLNMNEALYLKCAIIQVIE